MAPIEIATMPKEPRTVPPPSDAASATTFGNRIDIVDHEEPVAKDTAHAAENSRIGNSSGGNQPVRDERTNKVYITTQNHGFNVDDETLRRDDIEVTFINLNDHTIEGLKHKKYPLFSVQFHPEAGPGPHDTLWLFDEFLEMVNNS